MRTFEDFRKVREAEEAESAAAEKALIEKTINEMAQRYKNESNYVIDPNEYLDYIEAEYDEYDYDNKKDAKTDEFIDLLSELYDTFSDYADDEDDDIRSNYCHELCELLSDVNNDKDIIRIHNGIFEWTIETPDIYTLYVMMNAILNWLYEQRDSM